MLQTYYPKEKKEVLRFTVPNMRTVRHSMSPWPEPLNQKKKKIGELNGRGLGNKHTTENHMHLLKADLTISVQ